MEERRREMMKMREACGMRKRSGPEPACPRSPRPPTATQTDLFSFVVVKTSLKEVFRIP